MDAQIHEITADGRERHYFDEKKDGFWVCPCGAMRDAYGRPVTRIQPAS